MPAGWATKTLVAAALVCAMGAGAARAARTLPSSTAPAALVAAAPAPAPLDGHGALTSERLAGSLHPSAQPLPASPAAPLGPAFSTRAAPGTGDVAAEVRLLGEANTLLRAGDAGRALRLLEEHARRYPKGALGEERDAARIAALCALGRTSEARDATDRFVRTAPLSPQAGSLRASCGGSAATTLAPSP